MASSSNPPRRSLVPYDDTKHELSKMAIVYWAHHRMKPTTIQWIIAMAPVDKDEPKVPKELPEEYLKYDAAYQNDIVDKARETFQIKGWDFDNEVQKGEWLANGQTDLYSLDNALRVARDKTSKVAELEENGFNEKHQGRTWISEVYKAASERARDYRKHKEMASEVRVKQGPSDQDQMLGPYEHCHSCFRVYCGGLEQMLDSDSKQCGHGWTRQNLGIKGTKALFLLMQLAHSFH